MNELKPAVKFKPIPNAVPEGATIVDDLDDAWNVQPKKSPVLINKGKHVVHDVYGIPDDHGRTGYFKAKTDEVWQSHSHIGVSPFKSSIRDGALIEREILASDIANLLRIKNVPNTKWARIKHGDIDLGKGSLHMDPHDLLKNRGFTRNRGNFNDWRSRNKDENKNVLMDNMEHLERTRPAGGHAEELIDMPGARIKSALKNGGLDLAFFDFIIGNADRHNHSYFAGTNPETGESAFVGGSHVFSFPHDSDFFYPDFIDSLRGLWRQVELHGEKVEASESLREVLKNEQTIGKLKKLLDKSKLKPSEKKGTLDRLEKVRDLLIRKGNLTGVDLSDLLKRSIYGTAQSAKVS